MKAKKKTACIREIAADIAARFLSRQGRVQSGELSTSLVSCLAMPCNCLQCWMKLFNFAF